MLSPLSHYPRWHPCKFQPAESKFEKANTKVNRQFLSCAAFKIKSSGSAKCFFSIFFERTKNNFCAHISYFAFLFYRFQSRHPIKGPSTCLQLYTCNMISAAYCKRDFEIVLSCSWIQAVSNSTWQLHKQSPVGKLETVYVCDWRRWHVSVCVYKYAIFSE